MEEAAIKIFAENQRVYGTRKIKVELKKLGMVVSRRRIGRIMKKNGLVSVYTVAQYKPHKSKCNESEIGNVLNRQFRNVKSRSFESLDQLKNELDLYVK